MINLAAEFIRMSSKANLPKGTRDFSPIEMVRRNYIFDTIKKIFKKYGFQQIETPAMENLSTLVGSGGEESDKLIFKILNSGDYLLRNRELILQNRGYAYVNLHIYSSLKILFDEFIKLDTDNLSEDNFKKSIRSNIVDEQLGFHMYQDNANLLKLTSEFYEDHISYFRNIFDHLKVQVDANSHSPSSSTFYFEQFYRAHFLQNELYKSLLNIIITEIDKNQEDNLWLKPSDLTPNIAEKALHYDLTVPFARYVVQNQNDITFPFRRFQIQPVWRADRPQKGRYREFYQCDADIIGSDSLLNEVDLIKIIDDVFTELFQGKLKYTISINNRKILQGIVESVGETDKFEQIVVAIDKFDKISYEGVSNELINCDIPKLSVEQILDVVFSVDWRREISKEIKEADAHGCLQQLANLPESIGNTINGRTGIEELEFVFEKLKELGIKTANIKFDATLARGLGYYTGTIIEVKVDNFPSICGGGRYDDLTGKFGLKDVSGVGISFGADRIYDVLLDNKLYPEFKGDSTQVLFTNQSAADEEKFLPMLFELRDKGINAELYTEQAKWQKQLIFAEKKRIKFIVSTNENGDLFVKEMDGTEKKPFSSIDELITIIRK